MASENAVSSIGDDSTGFDFKRVINEVCTLNWSKLTQADLISVAWVYYHFSVQFRECLEIARNLYPDDQRLLELDRGERDTDNLSPWPGVATVGERMHHDEFMRRTLMLTVVPEGRRHKLEAIGQGYLAKVRAIDPLSRALALASYEDGGLENVFRSILTAQHWEGSLLQAFRHFLAEHVRFDSDPDQGHGALCRHLPPDDRVQPLWAAFKEMLIQAVPHLAKDTTPSKDRPVVVDAAAINDRP
jgi:hypothetical protein